MKKNSTLSRLLLFVCMIALFIAGKHCTSSVKEANRQKYFKEVDEAFAQLEHAESTSSAKESDTWDYEEKLMEVVEQVSKKLPQKVDDVSLWISKIKQRECLLIKFNGHSFFFFAYKTH